MRTSPELVVINILLKYDDKILFSRDRFGAVAEHSTRLFESIHPYLSRVRTRFARRQLIEYDQNYDVLNNITI